MEKIPFNLMQLIEETQEVGERFISPAFDSFNNMQNSFHTLVNDVYYEIKVQKEEDYIWFEFEHGKPNPIDDKLTNINTGVKKSNLRQDDEAELLKQLFVLYHFNKKILFISNSKKKQIFEQVLKQGTEKQFTVKSFFKTKEEFISLLKSVDKISFTEARNLFNYNSKKRQALIDLTGTDAPDKFTLEAHYKKKIDLVGFIGQLIDSQKGSKLKELIIQGTDESDFNFIFNVDSFVRKIEVQCEKENNGKYNPESVRKQLIKVIEE